MILLKSKGSKRESGNGKRKMRKDISEKSRLEKDLRGDGEERNETVHWLKHGEGNRMLLIIPGAFRGGLDGKGSKKSEEVMLGHTLGPTDGIGSRR